MPHDTYRDSLKEDMAREHWEENVRINSAMHEATRLDKAEHLGMTIEEYEEDLFQTWYKIKKAKGMAQFGDPWATVDGEDDEGEYDF